MEPTPPHSHKDYEVHLKGSGQCKDDATAPLVGAAELLSCSLLSFLFPDDGGRALHLCPLLSAVFCWGSLCRPIFLLILLLFLFFLLLFGFGHRCHVPGAEDNFCLGLLPLCFPPHPHCEMLPDPLGPVPEHAHLHLG